MNTLEKFDWLVPVAILLSVGAQKVWPVLQGGSRGASLAVGAVLATAMYWALRLLVKKLPRAR